MDEIKKSINLIFTERVSSPFYGTLIVSWLIWNWKITYLTFFVDQDKIAENKIDFILKNYNDVLHLTFYPLISTIFLLTLVPFLTNAAYWLDLKFTTWRVSQKNEIEGKRLLTIEQSIKLRSELRELENNFEKLLEKKNEEIARLQNEINSELSQNTISSNTTENGKGRSYTVADFNNLYSKPKLYAKLKNLVKTINETYQVPEDINDDEKEFFLVNEIISEEDDGYGKISYDMTYKGKQIYKEFFNQNFK
jgi:hypothetical protein